MRSVPADRQSFYLLKEIRQERREEDICMVVLDAGV